MFRGGSSGGKTREEFVEEIADVYISKVLLLVHTDNTTIAYERRGRDAGASIPQRSPKLQPEAKCEAEGRARGGVFWGAGLPDRKRILEHSPPQL